MTHFAVLRRHLRGWLHLILLHAHVHIALRPQALGDRILVVLTLLIVSRIYSLIVILAGYVWEELVFVRRRF